MRRSRAYIIYRNNGRYYANYSRYSWTSDPKGFGQVVVDVIFKERENYTEWLTKLRSKFQEIEEFVFGKESIAPIEVIAIPFEEHLSVIPHKEFSRVNLRRKDNFARFPTLWPPPNRHLIDWTKTRHVPLIDWTYTIDLDRELFSVDHEIHFPLSAIPDTWVREIYLIRGEVDSDDDNDDSDVMLPVVPKAIDISYPKPAVDETHVQLYEKANCSILQVEVSDANAQFILNSVHEGLCFELAKNFIDYNQRVFRFSAISSWGPEDLPFKELSFVLLFLADRYSFSLLPSPPPEANNTDIGVAYPTTSSFWFAGAFVYLTTHLRDDAVRKSAIGHVLELTKNCPRTNFTAFLFSIRELVVIDISEEGVKHTETLPFCDIFNSVVHNAGLGAMITYFTRSRTSLANHRPQTLTNPSSLPYDILLNIVKYVDWETTVTLSTTSKLLRECVERLGPKLGNLRLLEYDARSGTFLACRDGDALVRVRIQHCDAGSDFSGSESFFVTKIHYLGVRQQAFIPMISVKEVNSDSASASW